MLVMLVMLLMLLLLLLLLLPLLPLLPGSSLVLTIEKYSHRNLRRMVLGIWGIRVSRVLAR